MNEIVWRRIRCLCVSSFDSFVSHIILDLVSFLLPETKIKNILREDLPEQREQDDSRKRFDE